VRLKTNKINKLSTVNDGIIACTFLVGVLNDPKKKRHIFGSRGIKTKFSKMNFPIKSFRVGVKK
jgi:hypothetical protein